jgi:hypothetical protein
MFPVTPPPADSRHLIKGWPVGKCIVGSMNQDKPPPFFMCSAELGAEITGQSGAS